ncbi:MAG TPA: transporter, partial [Burkholderiaceae bacterium]
ALAAATDPLHRPASGDAPLGARLRVLQGDADTHIPCVSWMADVQPATGFDLAHTSILRPSVHLSAEWALADGLSLGVMPGMAFEPDLGGRRSSSGTVSVTLGKAWSPQLRTYLDVARDRVTSLPLGGPASTVDAGVTILAGPGTQLDLAVTRGLSPTVPPFQAGLGVSSRF